MDAEQEWIAKYRAALDLHGAGGKEIGLVRSVTRKLRGLFGNSEQVRKLPVASSREQTEFSKQSLMSAEKSAGARITSTECFHPKPIQSSEINENDLRRRAS